MADKQIQIKNSSDNIFPKSYWKKIWENSDQSPSTAFNAQTIHTSEAITNFDLIAVSTTTNGATMNFFSVPSSGAFAITISYTGSNTFFRRAAWLCENDDPTQVRWLSAVNFPTYGGSDASTAQTYVKPLAIFGIKL